jgi:hypothetical protein
LTPGGRIADLDSGKPIGVRLLGEDVVIWTALAYRMRPRQLGVTFGTA